MKRAVGRRSMCSKRLRSASSSISRVISQRVRPWSRRSAFRCSMVRPASAITCSTLARLPGWWMVSTIRISGVFIAAERYQPGLSPATATSDPRRSPIIGPMKRLIAIVEDEPAIRDNYAAAFTREGYVVRTYGNRAQAMAAFAARLPDLAVIDISLEDEPEGGFELCRQLRALSAELPIIFLTARDSELD